MKPRPVWNRLLNAPLHPFLAAAYPVLALLAANLSEVETWVALRPLAAMLALAALTLAVLRLPLRSWGRAALAATGLLLLFSTYGHVYNLLETSSSPWGKLLGHHRALAPLWAVLAAGALLAAARVRRPARLAPAFNLILAVLVILPLAQIALHPAHSRGADPAAVGPAAKAAVQTRPDIYYIVLDLYTRQDVLAAEFGVDNGPFLQELEGMGFYVAGCARSNYEGTQLSLASSLNLDYLPAGRDYREVGANRADLIGMIQDSRVRAELERLGYQTVAFETGFYWTQWMDADIYLAPSRNALQLQALRPFESLFIKSTALSAVLDARSALTGRVSAAVEFPHAEHIQRTRFTLARLPGLAGTAGPKLVFAHILVPHNPQVFAADGQINTDPGFWSDGDRPVNDDYFRRGYAGQVVFIDDQIAAIARQIQAQSSTPPVIIIQGDHGVYYDGYRHAILNALSIPGVDPALLRPGLSPVNTFRLVFNTYFGANLPLLPDRSFLIEHDQAASFTEIPETVCRYNQEKE